MNSLRLGGNSWPDVHTAQLPPALLLLTLAHRSRCLQWKCGLLQQLSDLTLKQNDEKTATLRQLIESESMLDAEAAVEAAGGAAMQ